MSELINELYKRLDEKEDRIIQIRRELHQHAEPSFQEEWTSDYIAKFYEGKDCTVRRNVGNGYGILVDIDSGKPGPTVALRADFDGLPIQEESEVDFPSQTGAMHAWRP